MPDVRVAWLVISKLLPDVIVNPLGEAAARNANASSMLFS